MRLRRLRGHRKRSNNVGARSARLKRATAARATRGHGRYVTATVGTRCKCHGPLPLFASREGEARGPDGTGDRSLNASAAPVGPRRGVKAQCRTSERPSPTRARKRARAHPYPLSFGARVRRQGRAAPRDRGDRAEPSPYQRCVRARKLVQVGLRGWPPIAETTGNKPFGTGYLSHSLVARLPLLGARPLPPRRPAGRHAPAEAACTRRPVRTIPRHPRSTGPRPAHRRSCCR
jgi:hypothetical protein